MPDGRVLIAFDDGPLEPDPAWTRIDDTDDLVAGIDLHSGKQTEFDRTDTGTASLYLNDTQAVFDPLNPDSPYFGKLDGKQIMFQVWNPVSEAWFEVWRGWIDDYGYDINPATDGDGNVLVANVQVDCVDMFDYLGGFLLQPGVAGKTAPAGAEGTIHYYGATATDPQAVDDRIIEALTDAGVDSTRWVVFSGNVNLQPTTYDPGEAILNVLRDAADAEGPFIANIYVDRQGRFVFHGIYARFDPDDVATDATPGAWDFTRWKLGDGAAIAADSERAQMRVLAYSRARSEIVNSAISYPRGILEADIPGQVYEDATSITDYGQHAAPPMTDLVINAATTAGAYPPSLSLSSANARCLLFAKLVVKNHKDPGIRIKTLTVKALRPDGSDRATKTWDLLCRADISDVVNLLVSHAGGVGYIDNPLDAGAGADYYVEGRTMRIRPLNPVHDLVELDLEVSPAEWSMDTHGVFA